MCNVSTGGVGEGHSAFPKKSISHCNRHRGGVLGFYLHGGGRRSRHSDSLALGKQAGRQAGTKVEHMHKAPHTQAPRCMCTHTHTPCHRKVGKRTETHIAKGENAARRENAAYLVNCMEAHKHTHKLALRAFAWLQS